MMDLNRRFRALETVDPTNKNYVFWDTQPVPKLTEVIDKDTNTFIEPDLPISKVFFI